MPAWSPGRYVIYNFAKNVFDVQVKTENDQTIRPILIDKQTWKIPTQKAKQINISYQLFANTLDGTFSKIDSVGASINGASVFAYIAEMKNQPLQLTIHVPESWQTVCALNPQNNGLFNARSYDELIDSPIELGPTLHKHHFQVLGKDHHLIFHQPVDGKLLYHFQQDLEKIITYFASLFGDSLPYHNYTFFFHLNKNLQHTDGMEHTANCRVLLRMDLNQIMPDANADADYDNLIWLSAHEFFTPGMLNVCGRLDWDHLITVKKCTHQVCGLPRAGLPTTLTLPCCVPAFTQKKNFSAKLPGALRATKTVRASSTERWPKHRF